MSNIHPQAGKRPTPETLTNIPLLISQYYLGKPDAHNPSQAVSFGTSGHRGTSFKTSFNENHILAIVQAVCEYRQQSGITGPLFLGMDTHALSQSAFMTALEVLAANGVQTKIDDEGGYTPTPVVSHAILHHNKNRKTELADGLIITPSHNPPTDGGIKYNPPNGGPADTNITSAMQKRANEILLNNCEAVKRIPYEKAIQMPNVVKYDYAGVYIPDLANVLDMEAISKSNLKIAADALGGSGLHYWKKIAKFYNFKMDTFNTTYDPTFGFMCVDRDGKIRMDCSSPWAIAGLVEHKDKYDIAFGNDPDFDRHGIVTPEGLMNPNHYLSVVIEYLFTHRPLWSKQAKIGKTLVSSSMIDRVAAKIGRTIAEVPVGFKWFVDGLIDGSFGFGGEESAGASFLRKDGTVWTTDKDGIIMSLLAIEITAVTGKNPNVHYAELTKQLGKPVYTRIDSPATPEMKKALITATPESIHVDMLAGEKIKEVLTHAPFNHAAVGGLKVVTENGWFASRPSGTEDICKIYAESFIDETHLNAIIADAQKISASLI